MKVSLIANLGILFFFKYSQFLVENIDHVLGKMGVPFSIRYQSPELPLGLSFHTFQSMAYTIDIFLGRVAPEGSLGVYALYVLFFPQLVAGPIERPGSMLPQLRKLSGAKPAEMVLGLRWMLLGFTKKLLIADNLGVFVDRVYSAPETARGPWMILATYFFAFQIYCDFSGYADIAVGTAKFFGIDLVQNFNRPYLSVSVREFWRRWHISLSSWFRDYLFKPLGGSQRGRWIQVRNIMIVFCLSGLWHGASWNFVIWGAINGFFVAGETLLSSTPLGRLRLPRVFRWIYTFHVICFSWVFFRADTFEHALLLIRGTTRNWPFQLDQLPTMVGMMRSSFFVS